MNVVLEVGGQRTINRSPASTGAGGSIAIIGGVSGRGGEAAPATLLTDAKRMAGIFVGSRAMFKQATRFIHGAGITPVVDWAFPFSKAKDAIDLM